ncbi:hypothetical protein V6N13_005716 [Hibiscus sabdariffa]
MVPINQLPVQPTTTIFIRFPWMGPQRKIPPLVFEGPSNPKDLTETGMEGRDGLKSLSCNKRDKGSSVERDGITSPLEA